MGAVRVIELQKRRVLEHFADEQIARQKHVGEKREEKEIKLRERERERKEGKGGVEATQKSRR